MIEYFLGCDHHINKEAMSCHVWEPWVALLDLNLLVSSSKGVIKGYFMAKTTNSEVKGKESVSQDAHVGSSC